MRIVCKIATQCMNRFDEKSSTHKELQGHSVLSLIGIKCDRRAIYIYSRKSEGNRIYGRNHENRNALCEEPQEFRMNDFPLKQLLQWPPEKQFFFFINQVNKWLNCFYTFVLLTNHVFYYKICINCIHYGKRHDAFVILQLR